MNTIPSYAAFPDFEAFFAERSPFMLELIKSEFVSFLIRQRNIQWTPVEMTVSPPLAQPAPVEAASAPGLGRDRLFSDLVATYAQAMEYPPEVFTEMVELEAELGIDSVKQTEILGRISETYKLPRLPAN